MNRFSLFLCYVLAVLVVSSCSIFQDDNDDDEVTGPSFPCEDGLAANTYPCSDIDLYAVVSPQDLGGFNLNDIWGWTDPSTQRDYALVGLTDGVSFVDITNPNEPVVVGKLQESRLQGKTIIPQDSPEYAACFVGIGESEYAKSITQGSVWRDHKVYDNHLYVVSDAQPHGMQVFDLTRLRGFNGDVMSFSEDVLFEEIRNAHNIAINEQTGFAYVLGATVNETCDTGGLFIIDVNTPKEPQFAGCYGDTTPPRRSANSAYIHDAQCVIYSGPDEEHAGKEVCFNSAERSLVITDVTNKAEPTTIGFQVSPQMYYSHQGWLTEDQRYFLMNDELDEINLGRTTKTYVFDVQDLDEPVFVGFYEHNTESIDHNMYVRDEYVYATNYISGLRLLEIEDLSNAELSLAGFFDTEPRSFNAPNREFEGAWSNYPFFDSGVVIVSDINRGLFILRPNTD
ncbi:MAG: choice-of-anchor B family protein [Bacteroidota bacterium]